MIKRNNIPKLRFPEFNEEWKSKKLSSFLIYTPREVPKPKYNYLSIGIRSHFKGTFQRIDSDPSQIEMDKLFIVKNADLIVNITFAWEGAVAIATTKDDGGLVSHRFPTYTFDNKLVIGNFFKYLYPRKRFKYELVIASPGGAGRNRVLNKKTFTEILIFAPSIKEQERIANFLLAIDDKIHALSTKTELLNSYKKGIMQKIFSQEIRFNDDNGKGYSEWEEKKFKDVFTFHKTNSLSRAELTEKGEVMNIHYGDIHMKLRTQFNANIDKVSYLKNFSTTDLIKKGDLIIADASEDRKDIGKTVEIINIGNKKIVAGLHTFLARPKNLTLGFSGYLMQSNQVRKHLWRIATGASVLGITKNELEKMVIDLPSKDEQQKIANFLTKLDDKIELEERKLEQAKLLKKSLLQQMFV